MTNRQKCYENLAFISDVFKEMSIDVLNKEIIDGQLHPPKGRCLSKG